MRGSALLLVLAGCDKLFLGHEPIDAPPQALDGPTVSDLVFGTPKRLANVNTSEEEDRPTLTDDLLELYFHRGTDMYVARRPSTDVDFSSAQPITELSEAFKGCVAGDGLRIYFSRNDLDDERDIYIATRASRAAPWDVPVKIPELITFPKAIEYCGWERRDRLLMYFSVQQALDTDIWRASRTSTSLPYERGPFPDFSTMARENAPWASEDGTIVVFDRVQSGRFDLLQATLVGAQYQIRPLDEINRDDSGQGAPWLSPDGHVLFYVSNHEDPRGDIYMATR
jgi:WD40-like Beta Propeller Repeat